MSLTVEKCLQAWTNSLRQMNLKADIVFFGDSLTYYGDFSSVFPDKIVCNLGLRGDTIDGLIDRIEQVRSLNPSVIFLMIGINDVARKNSTIFEETYDKLIKKLKEQIPTMRIVLQSILPVNNIDFSVSCSNAQISNCNGIISLLADKYGLQYVDLYSEYEHDIIFKNITKDGIHLKSDGYSKWYKLVLNFNMNI